MYERNPPVKNILILSLIFLLSCSESGLKSQSLAEVDWLLSSEWIYALKIEGPQYNNEEITRPPGVEQLVMSIILPDLGGLNSKHQCLYYTVKFKEKKSSFRIQEFKNVDKCPEISDNERENFVYIEDIDNLKLALKSYQILLNFKYNKKDSFIEIMLPNIEEGLLHNKYESITSKSLKPGLKLLRLTEESFDFASNKNLGKLSDRFSLGTAIRCQQVDKNCESVGENRCEKCRYGWYEVVDFQCPSGGSKFCGQNHCGEKNEPACPRGTRVVPIEEAGLCQSDLEPVANFEKILVCQ